MPEIEMTLEALNEHNIDESGPVLLYQREGHAIYWLGISEETAFRCNTYLIVDGKEGYLVDPGGRQYFTQVCERVEQIVPAENITAMILCHQDPDVAGSMAEWLQLNPAIKVFATPRTHVLLPYYGYRDYPAHDVEKVTAITLSTGGQLRFIPAPFLHFPGAFVTYDTTSGYLFSGDIWAALDTNWHLVVDDFPAHIPKMDLFHKDYMASQVAACGFVDSIADYPLHAILPQHGSIIRHQDTAQALRYLQQLHCGIDIIYAGADDTATEAEKSFSFTQQTQTEAPSPVVSSEFPTQAQGSAHGLHESLAQATRLAEMRDKALRELAATQKLLQARSALLSEAQKIAHVGNWLWRIGSDTISWSDEIYRIFGVKRGQGEISYKEFLGYLHADDRQLVAKAVQNAIEHDAKYDLVHRIIRPDGVERIVHERAVISRDESGRALSMHGTVQDITEQKQAEHETKIAREFLHNVIDFMPAVLLVVNTAGHITHWNQQATMQTGLSEEQALGKRLEEVALLPEHVLVDVQHAIARGERAQLHKQSYQVGREKRSVNITLYPVTINGSGGTVIIIEDISDRVRVESMMVQTEKMLSVGGLAAGMAHELNNPLGGILQGLQNIQRRLSPELEKNLRVATECDIDLENLMHYLEQRQVTTLLDGIANAGHRATAIVSNMMNFSRTLAESVIPVDMAALIDSVVELAALDYDMKKKYHFREINIVKEYATDLPYVPCLEKEIKQVILNLLRNAAQALCSSEVREHTPKITLRTELHGEMARIEVEDNGPGMDEATRQRIFEPFFTTRDVGEGTGLGLAVAYYLIHQQHHGNIEVESTLGEGARFIIHLPLQQAHTASSRDKA